MTTDVERLVGVQTNMLERWELHRDEMTNHMDRLAKLAVSFTELGAFDDAARCLIKADGLKYALARMPEPAHLPTTEKRNGNNGHR